jgi:hypothetical protein
MSFTVINQRLFGIQLFKHPTDICRLTPFFYTIASEKELQNEVPEPVIKDNLTMPALPTKPTTEPRVKLPTDTLFWNIFIAVYGEKEFHQIGSKYANRELEEKNRIRLEYNNKQKEIQTTNHKVTLGNVKEMMSEYMTGIKTSLLGVIGLSVYYKMPIYLVDEEKKTHLPFIPQNTDKEPCILFKRKGKFQDTYELRHDETSVENLRKTTISLENYLRPLRAISTYKRAELDRIAETCGLSLCDKPKDEVYKTLSEYLVWK